MCHPPSFQQTDLVRGAVPDPKQPLPPPTTPAYYNNGGQFVSADTTYLQQDFSLVQPVLNSGNWSSYQRFDYFVTVRKVDAPPVTSPAPDGPYRKAIEFALRELSGRPNLDPAWLAGQKALAQPVPDTRLAEVAQLVSLQTDPRALVALKEREFVQPLLSTPGEDLDAAVREMQGTYGPVAARTAIIAYLEPLTRRGQPEARAKAIRLLVVAAGFTPDSELPAAVRTAAAATSPAPVTPAPAPAAYGPAPERASLDRRGLPDFSLAKRVDHRKTDELETELLGVREISLDMGVSTSVASELVALARTNKSNGRPYPGTVIVCKERAELAGLPFRLGLGATLAKEKAEALHALSTSLRTTVQGCIRPDDPRPNTDALYAALLSTAGARPAPPTKWATAEAVPCVQQILAAENRDIRRLACEMLARINTSESTAALVRWAVFDTDAGTRAAAVEALRGRAENVAPQLLRYVRYPWPRAAEHAAEALVALSCKDAIPQLAALYDLPDPDAPFRLFAPPAPAAPKLDRPPGAAAPAPVVVTIDPGLTEALSQVARTGLRAADEAALGAHAAAGKALDPLSRRKSVDGIVPFLTHEDPSLRQAAAEALIELGDEAESAAPALRDATKDPNAGVRKAARAALDKIEAVAAANRLAKLREALAVLVKELGAKEPEDRVKALLRIAEFGPDANLIGEHVIEAMRDKVPAVQTAAAATLEKINPKVHPHVVTILRGPIANKRDAIQALGKLGREAEVAVPLLLYCDDHTPFWGGGNVKAGQGYEDLLPVIAQIGPKDRRFSDTVLKYVSTPNPKRERPLRDRRLAGVAQIGVIEAKTADKVGSRPVRLTAPGDRGRVSGLFCRCGGTGPISSPTISPDSDASRRMRLVDTSTARSRKSGAVFQLREGERWPSLWI